MFYKDNEKEEIGKSMENIAWILQIKVSLLDVLIFIKSNSLHVPPFFE